MKFILFVLAMIVAAAVAATLSAEQQQFLFTKYVEQYNKNYETKDFFAKFETFKSNLDLIVAHNAKNLPWKMAVNQFADLSAEEFAASHLHGLKTTNTNSDLAALTGMNIDVPRVSSASPVPKTPIVGDGFKDWSAYVGPVKNQASCGSCWAFSATGTLEAHLKIQTGKSYDLAEQQLVDCSGSYGNEGCSGGLMDLSYEYMMNKNTGACQTADYPYTARDGSCKACTPVANVKGYYKIPTSEQGHIEAIQSGPTAITLAASSSAFQFYSSGVLTKCSDSNINHALISTAYINDDTYGPVWKIRNSWGASWGNGGYIYIQAGKQLCGFTTSNWDVQITGVVAY
eukprot:UN04543